jgi:hypothetical protein
VPKSDREVFEYFRASTTAPIEGVSLTYALYAFEKFQWHAQFEQEHGTPPSELDSERWILDITPSRFASMREEAARVFDSSARKYLFNDIEAQKQEAVRTSILAEVKAAGSFWRQLATALITAILAPLIIGGVIVAALTYDHFAPLTSDVAKRLGAPPASQVPTGAAR